jgi:release factor glutamine methyltransferase
VTSIASIVDGAVKALCDAGFSREEARQDAVVLARGVLKWSLADWLARSRTEAGADFQTQLADWIERRCQREPVAYILGEREFYGRPFQVTRDTLIPRPETEGLVDAALEWLRARYEPARVIDVGTGTGCVAITIALECQTSGTALDIAATDCSDKALTVARDNTRRLGAHQVDFRQGSLLAGAHPVDLIVSNPPYVALADRGTLPADVVDFEPAAALFAGDDGLEIIRGLVAEAQPALSPKGALMLEVGAGQADQVGGILRAAGFARTSTRFDLQGIERIVIAHRTGASL